MLDLVAAGLLKAGDIISAGDPELDILAEITDDGEILLGDHSYDTPSRAAHAAGAAHSDGWELWQLDVNGEATS